MYLAVMFCLFFFFNDTPTTEIYTLSLHDALPIWSWTWTTHRPGGRSTRSIPSAIPTRSEEHTSELQSRSDLVCRLLLEKNKDLKKIPQPVQNTNGKHKIMILNVNSFTLIEHLPDS